MTDQLFSLRVEDNASAGANAAAAAIERVGVTAERTETKVTAAGRSAVALAGRYDDVTRAASRLTRAEAELAAARDTLRHGVETGTVTLDQQARALAALESKVSSARRAAVELHGTLDSGVKSTNGASAAVRGLGIQMFDVVPQLASGANVMTTLVQQGGQVAQMAAATGTSFGALARGAAAAVFGINPLILAAGAAVAGIAALGLAAETADRRMAGIQNTIRATRTDYEGLAATAEAAARAVARSGNLGLSDARGAATAIVARPEFVGSQGDLESLIRTAENLAARLGIDATDAAKKLAGGMRDAAGLAREFEGRLVGFDTELTRSVDLQARAGRSAEAYGVVLDKLKTATDGAADQALTSLGRSVRDLGNAFNQAGDDGKSLAESLGKFVTGAAAAAVDQVTALVRGIESLRQAANRAPAEKPPTPTGLRRGVLGSAALMAQAEGAGVFDSVAAQSGLPAEMLTFGRATMLAESRGVQGAVSSAGAIGLMGLMPGTAAGLGVDPTDARQNVQGGLKYIAQLWSKYGGDADLVAMAYNWGPGNLDRFLASSRNIADVPAETRSHVAKITGTDLTARFAAPLPVPPVPPDAAAIPAVRESSAQLVDRALSRATSGPTADRQAARADIDLYTQALATLAAQGETTGDRVARLNESLTEAAKRAAEAQAPTSKLAQDIVDQTAAADRLTRAYGVGYAAVRDVTAAVRAETDARQTLGRNAPGYAALIAELTTRYVGLAEAQARASLAAKVQENRDQLTLIEAENAALGENSDARALMLSRLRAEQTLKRDAIPVESNLGRAYLETTDAITRATQELDLHRRAIDTITAAVTGAADQIAGAITNAFISGNGAAVNWANVAKGALAQVASAAAKLAIINPVLNSVLGGERRPTLFDTVGAVGAAAGGGASGGGLLSTAGSVLNLGRLTDSLGLTDLGGTVSRLLGFGDGGAFSGIGNSISGFLNSPILGGEALTSATNSALAGLGPGVYGPATPAQVGLAGTTFGQVLGGVGLGFGLGSFGGGLLQSALGRTGPAPTIGAGVGAVAGAALGSIVPGIGTVLGGALGGLFGGGVGGFIGPGKKNPFSATGLTVDENGMLAVGRTVSQLVDTTEEVNALKQQVAGLNAVLAKAGVSIANRTGVDELGQTRIIGAVSGGWNGLNIGQSNDGRPTTLAEAFTELRFKSSNPDIAPLVNDKAFGSPDDLAKILAAAQTATDFLEKLSPALAKSATNTGSWATQLEGINAQFAESIRYAHETAETGSVSAAVAERLRAAEQDLTSAREKATKTAMDAINRSVFNLGADLVIRHTNATMGRSEDPAVRQAAALFAFDDSARRQRDELDSTLTGIWGEAVRSTESYAAHMASLERTLAAERLAIIEDSTKGIKAAEQQRAAQMVTSLSDYAASLVVGPSSGLSAAEQYATARATFDTTRALAAAGDATAIGGLQRASDSFLAASRPVNGAGANYARDFADVLDALRAVTKLSPDTLTQAVFTVETRTASAAIVDALAAVRTTLDRIEQNAALNRLIPAR